MPQQTALGGYKRVPGDSIGRKLTCGFEIEVLVPTMYPQGAQDPRDDYRTIRIVQEVLKRWRIPFDKNPEMTGHIRGMFTLQRCNPYVWHRSQAVDCYMATTMFLQHILKEKRNLLSAPAWLSQLHGRLIPNVYELSKQECKGWNITHDFSLRPPLLRRPDDHRYHYCWVPIEINSDPPGAADMEFFKKCGDVAATLRDETRAETNMSCGMHVHVGDGDKGLTLNTLKIIMATLFVFEPAIEQLHPIYRLGMIGDRPINADNGLSGEKYARGLRKHIIHPHMANADGLPNELLWAADRVQKAAIHGKRRYDKSATDHKWILKAILDCNEVNELITMFNPLNPLTDDERRRGLTERDRMPSRYYAYNLTNLYEWPMDSPHYKESKKTIEFRQHIGTLDTRRIRMWMRFCSAIVEAGVRLDGYEESARTKWKMMLFDDLESQCAVKLDPSSPPKNLHDVFGCIGITKDEIDGEGYSQYFDRQGYSGREWMDRDFNPDEELYRAVWYTGPFSSSGRIPVIFTRDSVTTDMFFEYNDFIEEHAHHFDYQYRLTNGTFNRQETEEEMQMRREAWKQYMQQQFRDRTHIGIIAHMNSALWIDGNYVPWTFDMLQYQEYGTLMDVRSIPIQQIQDGDLSNFGLRPNPQPTSTSH